MGALTGRDRGTALAVRQEHGQAGTGDHERLGLWFKHAHLAGLQGIPTELYEAATIDGAGIWRRFRSITIPMISPTLFFVVVTQIIWSSQVFTNVYVMTEGKGGPANATLMMVLYLYQLAFRQYRMGSSAFAWIFFLILLVFTLLLQVVEVVGLL